MKRAGLLVAVALSAPGLAAASEPRLVGVPPDDAAAAPERFRFSATHRSRFEHVRNQFRVGAAGDDLALAWRTTLLGELNLEPVVVGAELVDSRMYLAEGNARSTKADRRHFFTIARGSVQECVPLVEIARRRGLVDQSAAQALRTQLIVIAKRQSG